MFPFQAAAIFFSRDFRLGLRTELVYTHTTSCVESYTSNDFGSPWRLPKLPGGEAAVPLALQSASV